VLERRMCCGARVVAQRTNATGPCADDPASDGLIRWNESGDGFVIDVGACGEVGGAAGAKCGGEDEGTRLGTCCACGAVGGALRHTRTGICVR
jgi:hypothetical protein